MRLIAILLFSIWLVSCKSPDAPKPVQYQSLSQFPEPLRIHLAKIIEENALNHGLMWEAPKNESSVYYLYKKTSIVDLFQISESEHAILRALASEILMDKPGIDHFNYLKNHLSDTAKILVFDHEMGLWFTNPSDWILENQNPDSLTEAQTEELTDLLIIKHNYLRSAYTKSFHLPAKEKYYPYIRKMCERKREKIDEVQFSLYALSRFHKSYDVAFIKNRLLEITPSNYVAPTFFLFMESRDTTYFPLLRRYYYRTHFNDCQPDTYYYFSDCFRMMANAIAAYKSSESAEMLAGMMADPRFGDCSDKRAEAAFAVINNQCEAYNQILPQALNKCREYYPRIRTLGEAEEEARIHLPVSPSEERYHMETLGWW